MKEDFLQIQRIFDTNRRRGKVLSAPAAPNRNGSRKDHVMADESLPSPDVLRQLLRYEPDTGKLFWLLRAKTSRHEKTWNTRYSGKEAFTITGTDGYKMGSVFGRRTSTHRVAWAIYFGMWPFGVIDHIDGNPANNRIDNLRDVAHATNLRNAHISRSNTSGLTGVSWCRKRSKWIATITVNYKSIHLGRFASIQDASDARRIAGIAYGFHDNHGRAIP